MGGDREAPHGAGQDPPEPHPRIREYPEFKEILKQVGVGHPIP